MGKFICRIIVILTTWMGTFVQGQNIMFKHLTTDDGLSQISVNSLYFDEKGMLWIGTREGLNCYNGNNIKTFKLEKDNPHSLFCNNVLRIVGNRNGKIYLQCTEGIAEFNLITQEFTTLMQGTVSSIYYNEKLFIGQKNKIHCYNEQSGKFELYYHLENEESNIFCMHLNQNKLWLGTTENGVFCLNLDNHKLTHPIVSGNICSIYQDKEDGLWIGSWEQGVYHVMPNGEIENFRHDAENPNSISSNFVRACCEDDLGNIWIGTFNGLNRYNKVTGLFQSIPQDNGLTHSSIWCIVKDIQGTLWMGTYFGGVNYFNSEYEIYTRYNSSFTRRQGLSFSIVGRMVEDKRGNLWIGTEGGGLNYYDRLTKEFKWYLPEDNKNSLSQKNIKSLFYDANKEILWIGTHLGGLNKLDIRTGHFTHYRMEFGNEETLPSDIVRDIAFYQDRLVIATQNGVCLFDPSTGKCKQLFKDNNEGKRIKMVADIFFDNNATLWIAATGEGIFSYRFDTNRLKNYRHDPTDKHSIGNNNVNNIMQDSKGNLWFSTSGSGLDRYKPESDDFEHFDKEQSGLIGNCIYMTQESPVSRKLLLISNEGFSIFDPESKVAKNYSNENGFPLTSVNENALCVTRDGEIFLGGTQGMISYHEMELNFTPKPYNIILTNLTVNGKEITVNDDTGILKQALPHTSEITLNAEQSMFSIEFATSNYVAANKEDILYKLEGFSEQWNNTHGMSSITYTNLNAGTYQLILTPANKNISLCTPIKLTLHILPPWYKTVWAYLTYLVITGLLLWYLIHTYKTRIKLQERLKYEQKHIQDVEILNQSKLRFFTNISHEFRTPLTLIVAQVETLMQVQHFTPIIYNKVLSIYKNSIQLRELITELLDFRKQEQGHMKIKVSLHNIVDFLYENYLLFLEYAKNKQLELVFEKESDTIEIWYDQKQLQKVINNLLSNAMKHTEPQGKITLSIRTQNNYAVICVSDTGSGIDANQIDKIFDRFYQIDGNNPADASKSGTGIGLALTKGIVELHHGSIHVESQLKQGSNFIVKLPLGNKHFDEEEICQQEENVAQHIETTHPEMDVLLKAEVEETSPLKRLPDAKMVIVEDNDAIRKMLSNIFSPFYQIVTASDGEEGLQLVRNELPHIVVSDVVMPRMSGTEMCKEIKNDYNTCHIPVVLLTARTAIEQNMEGLRIGADDYITKPFNTSLLISRCNNLVNSRILLQEKFTNQPQSNVQMLATNAIDKELIDRAINIIERYLDDEDFNVNTFAREMAMARTNLYAKLKAVTGQTPNEFILTIRMKKAALMLRNNHELNISEIATHVGFSSPRYFARCFKDMYHISPTAYRKGEDDSEQEQTLSDKPEDRL